jgi:hypothetical protein
MVLRNPELASEGFKCLAGPFSKEEEPMMDSFINDAYNAKKEVRLSQNNRGLWIWHRRRQSSPN